MDIKVLKDKIEKESIDDLFMVWQVQEDSIIVHQYLKLISEFKHLDIKYIENLNEIQDDSFIKDTNLYVIKTKKWDSSETHNNCIVICDETKNKDAIKFPKLADWQIIDYVIPKVEGIPQAMLEELIKQYAGNFHRFISDMEKISIFKKDDQLMIFEDMLKEGCFDTLSDSTVFDLSNALIKRNTKEVQEVLKVRNYIDLTPMHLWTILLNNFKNIIRIQLDPKTTAESLGISDKQFFVIKKYNCGYYSQSQLIKIYKMLCSIENKFKFEELEVNDIIDYVICKIMGVYYE